VTLLRGGAPRWLGWGLAALVLAGCLLLVDPGDVAAALGRLAPLELAALLLLATLDRVLMALRWALLLRVLGVWAPFGRVLRVLYRASFAGAFLPTQVGGDLLRAYWLAREGEGAPGYPVAASLVMERLLGLLSAAGWALAGGAALAVHVAPGRVQALAGLGLPAALAAAAAALLALSLSPRVHGLALHRLGRPGGRGLAGVLRRLQAAYAVFGRNPRGLLPGAALTVVEHGVQVGFVLAVALSIGVDARPLALAAAAALYLLLARLPVAPDGWGVSELAAIGVFGLVGVAPAEAFSLSLVGRVVPMLALAPGGVMLLLAWRGPAVPAVRDRPVP
jgi:uncharacterized membrane protein YbhN (UPF0104 family)